MSMKKTTQSNREGESAAPATNLPSKKIVAILEILIILLAFANLAVQSQKLLTNWEDPLQLSALFNMQKVLSIPTIFFVLIMLIAAILLGVISFLKFRDSDPYHRQWTGLTYLFVFMTLDKGSPIHTYLFKQMRSLIHDFLPAYPRQKWVTTAIFILILIVLFFLKFAAALPKNTKTLALISLAIYYSGFMVIERFADNYAALYSAEGLSYSILFTVGRMLEMSGVVACIYTLLDYLRQYSPVSIFEFTQPDRLNRSNDQAV